MAVKWLECFTDKKKLNLQLGKKFCETHVSLAVLLSRYYNKSYETA